MIADGETTFDLLRTVSMELLTAAYAFAFGATVGSFLNVVAYRVPQGMGLLWPPSQCPGCGTKIFIRDNLPVVGWILRRGRCRACDAPISLRYPLVEFLTGLAFVLLAQVEVVWGGINLPYRERPRFVGSLWTVWSPAWDLIGIWLYHALLVSMLIVLVLLKLDRRVTPLVLAAVFAVLAVLPPVAWPGLHPQPADVANASGPLGILAAGLLALTVGAAIGWLLELGRPAIMRGQREAEGLPLGLGLVAATLGLPAAANVALLAAAFRLFDTVAALVLVQRSTVPPSVWLAIATMAQIVAWRWTAELMRDRWPVAPATHVALVAGLAVVVALLTKALAGKTGGSSSPGTSIALPREH